MSQSFLGDEGGRGNNPGPLRQISAFQVLLFGVALLALYGYLFVPKPTGDSRDPIVPLPGQPDVLLDVTFYCAESKPDVSRALNLFQNNDFKALLGMSDRGQIHVLAAGTKVQAFARSGGLSLIHVKSGYEIERRCWIPTVMLVQ